MLPVRHRRLLLPAAPARVIDSRTCSSVAQLDVATSDCHPGVVSLPYGMLIVAGGRAFEGPEASTLTSMLGLAHANQKRLKKTYAEDIQAEIDRHGRGAGVSIFDFSCPGVGNLDRGVPLLGMYNHEELVTQVAAVSKKLEARHLRARLQLRPGEYPFLHMVGGEEGVGPYSFEALQEVLRKTGVRFPEQCPHEARELSIEPLGIACATPSEVNSLLAKAMDGAASGRASTTLIYVPDGQSMKKLLKKKALRCWITMSLWPVVRAALRPMVLTSRLAMASSKRRSEAAVGAKRRELRRLASSHPGHRLQRCIRAQNDRRWHLETKRAQSQASEEEAAAESAELDGMLQTQQNELIRRVDAATTSAVQARLTQKRRLEKQLQIEARLLSEANGRQNERCVHLLDEEEQAAQVKKRIQALREEAHHDDQVGKQAEARARELRASIVLHHGGGGSVPHAAY